MTNSTYSIEEAETLLQEDDHTRSKKYKLARWVSNILSPPILFSIILYILAAYAVDGKSRALLWTTLTLLIAVTPPILYVKWLVRRGKLTDFYMQCREERVRPIIFILVWAMLSLSVLWLVGAPGILCMLIATAIFQMCILGIVTLFWKISFHSASMASAVVVVMSIIGSLALTTLPLVLLVGWSRVHLQRHTMTQVLAGTMAGFAISYVTFMAILPYFL